MGKRGIQVNDPRSTVLIDNISNSLICIPREGKKDLLLKPKQTGQLSWAEYITHKSTPHFGRYIKLNDSVIIADGHVKIRNIETDLNDDAMIEMLVQSTDRLKEFVLTLNPGECELFKNFLDTRKNLGIEEEKCTEIIEFMATESKAEILEEELTSSEPEPAPQKAKASAKRKRGRPKKDRVIIHENENALTAHVERIEDSE